MFPKRLIALTVLAALAFVIPNIARAQHIISGVVSDSVSHERLGGIRVALKPTKRGAITNEDGYFVISNVENGNYELAINVLGYGQQSIRIEVNAASADSILIS